MTDPEITPMEPTPPPTRRWIRFGWLLATPVAAALILVAALPARPSRVLPLAAKGGCDHTPGPDGSSACPHGVDAKGGCNMSAGGDSATGFPPQASPGRTLAWALPAGWVEESGGGGLRFATLTPPGPEKVDVSVIALPGMAGGEVANVNRWREQMGLSPITEENVASQRMRLEAVVGQVTVFEINNPGVPNGHMAVGMAQVDTDTWFLKMTGDGMAVSRARPAFLQLLRSLRPASRSPDVTTT